MTNKKYVLGISAFYHDSAAALICNGQVLAAAQEERFSRIKNDSTFPKEAIKWILDSNHLSMKDINAVVFYEKPFLKFERILSTCIRLAPLGYKLFKESMPLWIKDKIFLKKNIADELLSLNGGDSWNNKVLFSEHHLSHAAAAFYMSPFQSAAILTIDGVGEWATTTISIGIDNKITKLEEINFPHSFGLLYSAITAFLGFKVNSGEYKVMGLAPYGKPIHYDTIKKHLIDIKDDGSFCLNMKYFRFATEMKMFSSAFEKIFHCQARKPESPIEQCHLDLAASLQKVSDEVFILLGKYIKEKTQLDHLCLGGGVALNCASAGALQRENIFDRIWIQPSAGDAGSSLGAALSYYFGECNNERTKFQEVMPFYGPKYNDGEILSTLTECNAVYEYIEEADLLEKTAFALSEGKIVAWMQGQAEFSPRALGHRSILADPRISDLKKTLNLKIKFRESFRPFAPAVLAEEAHNWFEMDYPSPLMNFVCKAKQGVNNLIPSVIHVDETARVQTVAQDTNRLFHQLLSEFHNLTACPILVNTSFNIRGEPMVLSPKDAFNCLMNTGIDILVIGNFYIERKKQSNALFEAKNFELD